MRALPPPLPLAVQRPSKFLQAHPSPLSSHACGGCARAHAGFLTAPAMAHNVHEPLGATDATDPATPQGQARLIKAQQT